MKPRVRWPARRGKESIAVREKSCGHEKGWPFSDKEQESNSDWQRMVGRKLNEGGEKE